MTGLVVWILVLVTGPLTARVEQPFYTKKQECVQHQKPGWQCMPFVSQPDTKQELGR